MEGFSARRSATYVHDLDAVRFRCAWATPKASRHGHLSGSGSTLVCRLPGGVLQRLLLAALIALDLRIRRIAADDERAANMLL